MKSESLVIEWLTIAVLVGTGAMVLYGAARLNDWLPKNYEFCSYLDEQGKISPAVTDTKVCGWPR